MRIKHLLYLLFALPLAFVACENTEEPKPQVEKEAVLTLTSEATMEFAAEGGEGVITYTAKMVEVTRVTVEPKVEATCEADWVENLTVAENITFTVLANEADARETKVVVTYGDKSFEVVVKQAAEGEQPEPEYAMDVELAAAARIPSAEVGLTDNFFALAFVDDAENIEVGIVLKGAEGDTILKAGDYTSDAETLLVDDCEVFVWEPAAQYTFTEGVVAVAVEGDNYTFDMEFADDKGNLYHFTYEGTVLDMVPAEKPTPEAFSPVKVEAYREAHWDVGNFELDLYIDENNYHSLDMQDLVAPNDKYLTAGHYSMDDGSVTSWSNFVYNIETGEGAYIVAAEIDLTHNADGTSTLKGYFESEYGNHLDVDWTGVIAGFDFSTGGDTPEPGETVEFTASFFDGTYYGDGNYYIVVSDAEVTGNDAVDGATYYYFDIYAGIETEDLSVPNGVYTFDSSNSYADGTFTEEYGFGFITNAGVPTWYYYAEGSKITVSDNKIVAELILTDGSKHIVTYEGNLSLAGGVLSEDIEINATDWDVTVGYFGQYYSDETDNYYIELFEDVESGNGRYLVLDLLADYATCVDHSGTFTCSDSYGINTFLSGYLDGGYLAGSWYAELEGGAASGVMAPLTEGTVTVTLNSDGTETYVFDFKDDRGNKITGSVTANRYSEGYTLSAQPKTKSYAIELPKRVVR